MRLVWRHFDDEADDESQAARSTVPATTDSHVSMHQRESKFDS
jgi:hypothetical protein